MALETRTYKNERERNKEEEEGREVERKGEGIGEGKFPSNQFKWHLRTTKGELLYYMDT